MKHTPTIGIIGSGPAGASAAIQLKRFGYKVLLFESGSIGGLAKNANLIENLVGYPHGISGYEFSRLLKLHLEQLKIHPIASRVLAIRSDHNKFSILTLKKLFYSDVLVLACGTKSKKSTLLKNSESPIKDHVHDEIKTILKHPPKRILVIGGGDVAFDYSLSLAQHGHRVFLSHRKKTYRAINILQKRALLEKRIKIFYNSKIIKIDKQKNKLIVTLKTNHTTLSLHADELVLGVGRISNKDLLTSSIKSKPNVYIIGDMKHPKDRHISIAMGDGTKVAMQIYRKQNNENYRKN